MVVIKGRHRSGFRLDCGVIKGRHRSGFRLDCGVIKGRNRSGFRLDCGVIKALEAAQNSGVKGRRSRSK